LVYIELSNKGKRIFNLRTRSKAQKRRETTEQKPKQNAHYFSKGFGPTTTYAKVSAAKPKYHICINYVDINSKVCRILLRSRNKISIVN